MTAEGEQSAGPATAAPLFLKSARGRWVIAATVLGSGMALLDSTVVGIALPSINRSFHGGVGSLQWVVTGYLLTLAAFLLLGGSLGDHFGRRRIFLIGTVWFALSSAACGLAPSTGLLVTARVVQGVGFALMAPASLAIIQASFRPEDRAASHRGLVRPGWRGRRCRSPRRWLPPRRCLVALGVLHQPARRGASWWRSTSRHVPESHDPAADETHRRVGSIAGRCVPGRVDVRAHRSAD